jgi:hypothetical protein
VGLDAQILGYKLGAGAGTTAGQAAQKLYSCSGSSGDVVQTTAASQPLLLVHSGANYWWGSGVSGNYLSTPNAAANQITGDIDIIAYIDYVDNTTYQIIVSKKASSTSIAYNLYVNGTGAANRLEFEYRPSGSTISAIDTYTFTAFTGWVRFRRNSTTGEYFFQRSLDPVTTPISSISWTTNSTAVSTTGALSDIADSVRIGTDTTSFTFPFQGKIYRVAISNSIGGAPVVDFNPNTYNAATSQTQWTSSTGEVWTINTGTATTGYKGQIVTKTIVQGDGINDRLLSGTLTSRSTFSRFCATNPLNINIFKGIVGANAADRHYLYATSTDVAIYNGVALNFSGEQANRLALYEGDYNGASGSTLLNNTTSSSGNVGSGSSTVVELFALVDGSFGNVVINTLIDLSAIATTQQKTDTYNYIRSINNNAF